MEQDHREPALTQSLVELKLQLRSDRILEALRVHIGRPPTRNELESKIVRMKRKDFGPALKRLVADGKVIRLQSGSRSDPFRYKYAGNN